MKTALYIGGPLILAVTTTFLIGSGIVTFGDVDGLEVEQESIEYREGDEPATVRKQPGLSKYLHISIRRPVGFENWKFIFERKAEEERVWEEEFGEEMIQIEPPVLVIPAR